MQLWSSWRSALVRLAASSNCRAGISPPWSASMAARAKSSCPRLPTIVTSATSPGGTRAECFDHLERCHDRQENLRQCVLDQRSACARPVAAIRSQDQRSAIRWRISVMATTHAKANIGPAIKVTNQQTKQSMAWPDKPLTAIEPSGS